MTKHRGAKTFYKNSMLIVLSAIFISVVLFGTIIGISLKTKKYLFASGQTLYAYYTAFCDSSAVAEAESANQKDLGGAGYVYSQQGYYVCAFIYTNREDAESVCRKNAGGGIVEIKTQIMSQKLQKMVKNNENWLNMIHLIEDGFNALRQVAIDSDLENLSDAEVFSRIFVWLEKANDLSYKFSKTDDVMNEICDLLIFDLKNFIASSGTMPQRSSGLKGLCFKMIELYNLSVSCLEGTIN